MSPSSRITLSLRQHSHPVFFSAQVLQEELLLFIKQGDLQGINFGLQPKAESRSGSNFVPPWKAQQGFSETELKIF